MAPFSQKGFIGSDERFASLDTGLGNGERFGSSPHQLDDDLYGWISNNFFPVAHSGQGEIGAGFGGVFDGDPTNFELDAKALSDQFIGFGKVTDQA